MSNSMSAIEFCESATCNAVGSASRWPGEAIMASILVRPPFHGILTTKDDLCSVSGA